MAPRKLFGSLFFEGAVDKGENPNGFVARTPNGNAINGQLEEPDYTYGEPLDGRRWSRTYQESPRYTEMAVPAASTTTRLRRR
jgi:hypothetical protein